MDKIAQLEHEIEVLKLKKQVAELERDIAELQARPYFKPVVIYPQPYIPPYPYNVPQPIYRAPNWYYTITTSTDATVPNTIDCSVSTYVAPAISG